MNHSKKNHKTALVRKTAGQKLMAKMTIPNEFLHNEVLRSRFGVKLSILEKF